MSKKNQEQNPNEKIFDLMVKIKYGERARVMFDMLMEHLNAKPDIKDTGFWQLMKEAISGENKAQLELMQLTTKPIMTASEKGWSEANSTGNRPSETGWSESKKEDDTDNVSSSN